MNSDAIDAALARFATTGPEFGSGLSNHGPMAAEALVALGRGDAVERWTEWYIPRLQERPRPRNAITRDSWREALGEIGRAGDWIVFFERELEEQAWADVLETWVARLLPGVMAGATHGLIRTAHAVRSLDAGETVQRRRELAEALAYWAARYQEMPTSAHAGIAGERTPDAALARVPRLDASVGRNGLIFDVVRRLPPEQFEPAIDYLAPDDDDSAFVSRLTRACVRLYLANAALASISFIHTVTAPSALRMLMPHLSARTRRQAQRYTWQACAAIYAAYGQGPPTVGELADGGAEVDRADLAEQAIAARDEHAIKFTEACLRENALSPDPAFIGAAHDAIARLGRP